METVKADDDAKMGACCIFFIIIFNLMKLFCISALDPTHTFPALLTGHGWWCAVKPIVYKLTDQQKMKTKKLLCIDLDYLILRMQNHQLFKNKEKINFVNLFYMCISIAMSEFSCSK